MVARLLLPPAPGLPVLPQLSLKLAGDNRVDRVSTGVYVASLLRLLLVIRVLGTVLLGIGADDVLMYFCN